MFPQSISHSNNGDQLISIEFLPLFNRFTVLFELSKHASKSKFFKFQLFSFSVYPMISPLWNMVAVLEKRKKIRTIESNVLNVKENKILQHTFIL